MPRENNNFHVKRTESPRGSHPQIGILLINLGSPDAPTPKALRRYLAEFLSDRRVIDYPRWLWLPILFGVILQVRPRRSARLYRRIWSAAGSPLIRTTERIGDGVAQALRTSLSIPFQLKVAMRYGSPSISAALRGFRDAGITELIVLPLYPQYSTTTTGTCIQAVFDELKTWEYIPSVRTINHYWDHPAYISALTMSIREFWGFKGEPERLLFSFHGIPERYAQKGDPYPRHCQESAKRIANSLWLPDEKWQLSYQSRFGPEPWLQPYTDRVLEGWGKQSLDGVQVICPGFSADCLETLDEIKREGLELFSKAGGRGFEYIPALNDHPAHIEALTAIICDQFLETKTQCDPTLGKAYA